MQRVLAVIVVVCIGAATMVWAARDRHVVVARDGNILYYNSPAAVAIDEETTAISYLQSNGNVVVDLWSSGTLGARHIVHDHSASIDRKLGPSADDHAAPAIIYDASSRALYLATSYHSTDLYIYRAEFPGLNWRLIHRLEGRISYPRFVSRKDGSLHLFLREIVQTEGGVHHGHLVMLDLPGFERRIVKAAKAREGSRDVIYAGIPHVHDDIAYFGFTHFYGTGAFKGVNVGMVNLVTGEWREFPAFSDRSYGSTMPTGIWSDGRRVKLGLSAAGDFEAPADEVFIIGIDLDTRAETLIHRTGPLRRHYYNNVVDFDAAGNPLIGEPGRLNPQHVRGGRGHVYVVADREAYDLRDYDTSLHLVLPSRLSAIAARLRSLGVSGE